MVALKKFGVSHTENFSYQTLTCDREKWNHLMVSIIHTTNQHELYQHIVVQLAPSPQFDSGDFLSKKLINTQHLEVAIQVPLIQFPDAL